MRNRSSISNRSHPRVKAFEEEVQLKYELFNSLFLTLPFETIYRTGVLLPLLAEECEDGYDEGRSPEQIIRTFRDRHAPDLSDEAFTDLLFRFVQYVERQVVLFDALEDAAFDDLNETDGDGSIDHLFDLTGVSGDEGLRDRLRSFALRIVLTAHPTQFYPSDVLGIITDLDDAIRRSDVIAIKRLLMQLGRTPFMRREKPTPLEEAEGLIWHLEHVLYDAFPLVMDRIAQAAGGRYPDGTPDLIRLGFWPGGDRDGNPFVDADTTVQVAEELRSAVLRRYLDDVRVLRRRLTFRGTAETVDRIAARIEATLERSGADEPPYETAHEFVGELKSVRQDLVDHHDALFLDELEAFIRKVESLGFSFASIDLRQDSSVHDRLWNRLYPDASSREQIASVIQEAQPLDPQKIDDTVERDVLQSLRALRTIQEKNGESAAHRYIISHSRRPGDVLKVLAFNRLSGGSAEPRLDVVPLFETVDDLQSADETMRELFRDPLYRSHLERRDNHQTVMLGFSDGTKDGGFLAANWNIYRAKEALTAVAREFGIRISFFDGRGGPPARGGGKTHAFYASLGSTIDVHDIQLTIQGQTITSNFGTPESAAYNIEQLLTAGLGHSDEPESEADLTEDERRILNDLSVRSLDAYRALREDDRFLSYLRRFGPLDYYGEANIGSRPSRRSPGKEMTLGDLRAIPFVGTWNQMKQNVPGFYGFGTAIAAYEDEGRLDELRQMYRRSRFFRALVENSMMALSKCYFPLTAFLSEDADYGDLWNRIHDEYQRSVRLLTDVAGQENLLAATEVGRRSIEMRERIIRPLLTIQQFALAEIRSRDDGDAPSEGMSSDDSARKLVVRTMYGIINAGRNSA